MIQESVIDASLNRLQAHFKKQVHVRAPASAAELAELEEMVGPLPRDLTILLATCNGIRVQLESIAEDAHLCCLHEIETVLSDGVVPASVAGLLLLRGDPNSEGDWLVVERGPAHGCVVRWNSWTPGAVLMAGSVGQYVRMWVEYLVESFDRQGRRRVDRQKVKFDPAFAARHDSSVVGLRAKPEIAAWLHELDVAVPTGDDFE